MSSAVNRDVTVRINIANGNMKLGPLDISSFIKSMQTASAVTEALEKQLAGIKIPSVFSGFPGGFAPVGSTGPHSGGGTVPITPAGVTGVDEAITKFKTALGSIYTLHGSSTSRHRSDGTFHGASQSTRYVSKEDSQRIIDHISESQRKGQKAGVVIGDKHIELGDDPNTAAKIPFSHQPSIGAVPVEAFKGGGLHVGSEIKEFMSTKAPSAGVTGLQDSFKLLETHARNLAGVFADMSMYAPDGSGGGGQGGARRGNNYGSSRNWGDDGASVGGPEQFNKNRETHPQDEFHASYAKEEQFKLSPAERKAAKMAGRIQRQRMKEKEKAAKEEAAAIKRQAEEEAAAIAKAEKAQMNYAASSRGAAAAAAEFAKGMALVAASSAKSDDAVLRSVVSIQGYFNVVRGGMAAVNGFNDAMKARAALQSASAVGSPSGPATGPSGAGIGAEATSGGGGTTILGGLSSSLVSLTGLFVGLAAAAFLLKRQLNILAVEDEKYEMSRRAKESAINVRDANSATGRHVDQAIRFAETVRNPAEFTQTHRNLVRRGQVETSIREQQANSTRDFAGVQEIRARAEQEVGLQENTEAARSDLAAAERKQEALQGIKEKHEADKKASAEAYKKHKDDLSKEIRASTTVSPEGAALSGGESQESVNAHNAGVQVELGKAEDDRKKQLVREAEEEQRIEQESLRIGEQRVDAAGRLVRATREQVAAARQNYEQDKQTVAAAHQSLGAMSAGQRHILKQIEAKRKKGGKWEQWEIQEGLQAPHGTKLHDEALRQAEANDDSGLEVSPDVEATKKKLDEAQAAQQTEEPGNLATIQAQSAINSNTQQANEKLAKIIADQQEASAKTLKLLDQYKQNLEDQIRTLNRPLGTR